jgi:hypothetical protein
VTAGLLRFIPYVGVLIAGVGPVALAAAVDPGWLMVGYVTVLFLIVEMLVGYVIEPLLYGHSTGLSPVSVIVTALFWTWIWGPVGLVLSMPLTLMLVVLGRHIPAFEIFDVVLGDRPALSPAQTFYQRMLAGRPEDAIEQAEVHLETLTLAAYYDEIVLGGLRLAAGDVDRGAVEREALHAVCETTLEVLDALEFHTDAPTHSAEVLPIDRGGNVTTITHLKRSIICVPGRGPLDVAIAHMVAQLLRRAGCEVQEQARTSGTPDNPATPAPIEADYVCILGLFDDRAFRRMQSVISNLSNTVPDAKILIGVTRTDELIINDVKNGLFTSINSLCQAVLSV